MATDDSSDDSSDNPFIRFKRHIDNNVQRGFYTIFGSSTTVATNTGNNMSTVSPDYNSFPREPETTSSNSEMLSRDGGNASVDDVLSWAVSSSYSPANLQSLAQPRPNDAPPDYPDCFTFRDAFEDLLVASNGRPLSDLRRLLLAKQFENFKYSPWGIPVEAWVSSIGRQSLWGAYFPLSSTAERQLSYGLASPYLFRTKEKTFSQPQTFTWSAVAFPHWEYHFPPSDHDWTRYNEESSKPEAETNQCQEADTEEALYTNSPSKFTTNSRVGIDVLLAKQTDTKPRSTQDPTFSDPKTAPVSQTIETPSGGKILKTVQERTRNGGTETTTTTRQFDADGNLIAQGEETSWAWSRAFPGRTPLCKGKETSSSDTEVTTSSSVSGEANIRGSGKVSGWFWTR
ncbi:uncharacterized protein GGS22DRAFT_80838 [Annulohypoxylon maeteangense]|uniref:uncharacterized protein n=1 Tax=Annulohypoxylon maeteangense TaxID=1927788 RepID=UPI0020087B6C|nr:uncharacterized protein GGS22DRAFT_80838 [Annulohypoxylon maeteangense]KAI0880834.1 hypothetical protein GGS22DRAFT_80838 [Annulohypoxylon maeteangense]